MKLLVTGGAGFIGGNFIQYMRKVHSEDSICCLDKLTYAGSLEHLASVMGDPNFSFVQGDITDRELVYALFEREQPEVVVNFAAETHVDRSIQDPDVFLRTNVLGTGVLLDASRLFGVKRFHQISTDEVYGDLPPDRPDLLFTENSPLCPSSPYSASKAAADLLVLSYLKTYGLPVTISRCSNNYGAYQYPEKLIPLMVAHALANKPLPIYGNGENVRDWIAVEDHCQAVDRILGAGIPGQVYNVGGNQERSNLQMVKAILHTLGKPESLISFVADRPGHDLRYAVDGGKLRRELDWCPKIDFDEGIRETVLWYQQRFTEQGFPQA